MTSNQADGLFYDEKIDCWRTCVKWHTRQKHKYIEVYFKIWERVNKDKPLKPPLDIFDLYASTGLCYCEKHDINESEWDGTAALATKCLNNYSGGRYLFVNTYHDNEETRVKQVESIKKVVTNYKKGLPYTEIVSYPIDQAFDAALKFGERKGLFNYPNLWILDPTAASDLPWYIVEKIGNIKREYPTKKGTKLRKPELIITLMTDGLTRNYKNSPNKACDIAFGMEESEWRPIIDGYIKSGSVDNIREAIIKFYYNRLLGLYEKPPVTLSNVRSTDSRAIVYSIFLCTDHDAGHFMMELKGKPEFEKWQKLEWKQEAEFITEKGKMPEGQLDLREFI